jgi:hypothetical protein
MLKKDLELRMYFFVPYNISEIQKGIQAGHASLEYALEHGHTDTFRDFVQHHKTWIILNGGTFNSDKGNKYYGSLNEIEDMLLENKIAFSHFIEPDLNNGLSALCFIVDERVFNRKDYPDFPAWIKTKNVISSVKWLEIFKNNLPMIEIIDKLPKEYAEWVKSIGGNKNVFLRMLLNNRKLA